MKAIYHEGELAVQTRAGVREMAERVGRSIRASFPPASVEFLLEQPLAIIGSVGADGRAWASLVTGEPGFMRVMDEQTLFVGAKASTGDPLAVNLTANSHIGLLAIDFATRRRMRVNGRAATVHGEDGIRIDATQVYANCPKYIQAREWRLETVTPQDGRSIRRERFLTAKQRTWIAGSDTFFIASHHAEGGADVSHRGGMPGFVCVVSERELMFPDYSGNAMFQTLGNLSVNPSAGLLFVDWHTGSTLQLTGLARVVWEEDDLAGIKGAERAVRFVVDESIQIEHATDLRWHFLDYSPFNPV